MPELPTYTQAFRAYVSHVGGLDVVGDATGIGDRKLQRMFSGKSRIPPTLLRELASGAEHTHASALGHQLRGAADELDAANPRER